MKFIKTFLQNILTHKYKHDYLWFLMIPILNINYLITGNLYASGFNISMQIDKQLPVLSIFILPYIFWYIYIPFGLLNILFLDRTKYIRVFLTILIGMMLCYIVYVFFPTEYTRPVIDDSSLLNKLILAIYSNDEPFNCFPSIHVLTTYLIMRNTKLIDNKTIFIYTQITGILIILSTLFIKQHFVLDIVSAMLLAEILKPLALLIKDSTLNYILALPARLNPFRTKESNIESSSLEQ